MYEIINFIKNTQLPIKNDNMVYAISKEEFEKALTFITNNKTVETKVNILSNKNKIEESNRPSKEEINKMKGKELDIILKSNNLKVSGKVQEKKDRLVEYFTNI